MKKDDDLESIDLLLSSPRCEDDDDDDATIDPTNPSATTPRVTVRSTSDPSTKSSSSPKLVSRDHQQQTSPSPRISPATQTLNTLGESQQSADLQLSQLEFDVVQTLAQAARRQQHVSDKPPSCKQSTKKKLKAVAFVQENPANASKNQRDRGMTKNDRRKHRKNERCDIQQIDAATGRCVSKYPSFRAAEGATGIDRHTISAMVKGERKQQVFNGWIFRYVEQNNETSPCTGDQVNNSPSRASTAATSKETCKAQNLSKNCRAKGREIEQIMIRTGQRIRTFPTMTVVQDALGINKKTIAEIIKGIHETNKHGEWTLRYVSDGSKTESKTEIEKSCTGADDRHTETNESNAEQSGICDEQYGRFATSAGTNKQEWKVANTTFCTTMQKRNKASRKCGNAQPVQELDPITGQVIHTYPSSAAAAKETGIHPTKISYVVTGRIPNYKGRIFRKCNQDSQQDFQSDYGQLDLEKMRSGNHPTADEMTNEIQIDCRAQISHATKEEEKPDNSLLKTKKEQNSPSSTSSNIDGERSQLTEIFCDRSFQVFRVHIKIDGPLGLSIAAATPNDKTLAFIRQFDGIPIPVNEPCTLKMVQISGLKTTSCIGADAGLKKFDWLLVEKRYENDQRSFEFEYETVRDIAKRGRRPVTFLAIRSLHIESTRRELYKPLQEHEIDPQTSPPCSRLVDSHSASDQDYSRQRHSANKEETGARKENQNIARKAVGSLTKSHSSEVGQCSKTQNRTARPTYSATERKQASMMGEDDGSAVRYGTKTNLSPQQVPFCSYCNGRSTKGAVHHAWCPKNKQFVKSGADKVLNRIRLGVRLGCSACNEEYQKGRSVVENEHTKTCQIHQKDTLSGKKESRNYNSLESSETGKRNKPSISPDSEESQQSDGSAECDDDESVYQNPSPPFVSSRKFVVLGKNYDGKNDESKSNNKKRKSSIVNATHTKKMKKHERLVFVGSEIVKPSDTLKALPYNDEEEVDLLPDDKLTSSWEDCIDPWGRERQVEDDITVYNADIALCHHESIVPSPRFEIDPFAVSSRYRKTHSTPEEGFQPIVLQRDPLAQRPWGFSWKRHEFGGACLVTSVEPLSPAEAATYFGAGQSITSKAPLRINDMILTLNSKSVGGMTAFGFDLELERSGTELFLLVSRYRFADEIHLNMQNAELDYFKAVDAASNDDRLLNWTDIGYTGFHDQKFMFEKSRSFEAEGEEPTYPMGDTEPLRKNSNGESCHLDLHDKLVEVFGDDFHAKDRDTIEPKMGGKLSSSKAAAAAAAAAASCRKDDEPVPALDDSPATDQKQDDITLPPNCRQKQHGLRTVPVNHGYPHGIDASPAHGNHCKIDGSSPATTILKQCKFESDMPSHHDHMEKNMPTDEDFFESGPERQQMTHSRLCDESLNGEYFSDASRKGERKSIAKRVSSPLASQRNGSYDRQTDYMIHGITSKFADDHDGNAWCECVCSRKHGKDVPRFWIQCDNCQTWYFSSSRCLKFTEEEAPYIGTWSCWGCPDYQCGISETQIIKAKRFRHDSEQRQQESQTSMQDSCTKGKDEMKAEKRCGLAFELSPGDTVKVKEHAWPGVNNPEGFAKILKANFDEDGDYVYDIKYIVGGRRKGVLAQFLEPHSFC